MISKDVSWWNLDGAVQEILEYFVEKQRDTRVIYFDGWRGFGASAVLRAVADELKSRGACPELRLDKVIHIDCSTWKSRRAMQRAIAVELNLDASVIAIIDKADEEDDFDGVDQGSRGEIMRVAEEIDRAFKDHRFMVVFHNGSGDYIDLNSFGFPSFTIFRGYFMLWTFRRRFQGSEGYPEMENKVQNTHFFAYETRYDILGKRILFPVLQNEAVAIAAKYPCMREINPEKIVDCCVYGLFLYLCLPEHLENEWAARASAYWMCDGIIQGDQAWEISSALSKEIKWDLCPSVLDEVRGILIESSSENSTCCKRLNGTYFDENEISYPPMAITTSNSKVPLTPHDIQTVSADMSSYFLAPDEISNDALLVLADGLFDQSTNLRVLQLSHCSFSFASPPFIACQNLRFLGLHHCKDNETTKQIDPRKWQFLHSLWVLDLIYTGWYQVFSKEIAHLIINLRELNIVGPECWKYIAALHEQLPDVQMLRIVKSMDQPNASAYIDNYLMDKTKLELLDMSGTRNMARLPTNLSKARSLQVLILDGCDGLGNIVSDGLPHSLTSLSFDGYGPATNWTSIVELPTRDLRPSSVNIKKHIKTSTISLKGCKGLGSLFIRELPNLVELDLSGTAIKILDFTTMVLEVSSLKRLFLIGCEKLRSIKWGNSGSKIEPDLELLCIDTRPGIERPRPSFDKSNNNFKLQIHAVIEDARLARSLCDPIYSYHEGWYSDVSLSIHTSTLYDGFVQDEGACKDKIGQINDQVNLQQQQPFSVGQYHDVLSKVGDAPMQSFPHPPTTSLSRHIEIARGSHNLESELDGNWQFHRNLAYLMGRVSESLHVHDVLTTASMPGGDWYWDYLRWCRMERCPKMETIFPTDAVGFFRLETIWMADLPMARCIWSIGVRLFSNGSFEKLRHMHLRDCPRLKFVLPVWVPSFPRLCTHLCNIFVLDGHYPWRITVDGVAFPRLSTIHLHDLPMLQQICDVGFKMVAPALETIKIRGCWSLRRLPAVGEDGPKPAIEIEEDVWSALEWDGVEAGHHPSLFQAPLHSRYYKKKLPRGSAIR
ncbi:uncharacterized protein LOC102717704 [Oryza brachyantha]|uniref:uncharacterized protein LOC102717704 n=1 Tax=Oryza brachyantha TaxID=4533 RepID=UPI001ADB8084|nr:uncharacterized protein LOC102717704 [Oryza brachyantha]XP_040379342.1 uncharacterized protein LOC102717704 [Oryza brachyantha]